MTDERIKALRDKYEMISGKADAGQETIEGLRIDLQRYVDAYNAKCHGLEAERAKVKRLREFIDSVAMSLGAEDFKDLAGPWSKPSWWAAACRKALKETEDAS